MCDIQALVKLAHACSVFLVLDNPVASLGLGIYIYIGSSAILGEKAIFQKYINQI